MIDAVDPNLLSSVRNMVDVGDAGRLPDVRTVEVENPD